MPGSKDSGRHHLIVSTGRRLSRAVMLISADRAIIARRYGSNQSVLLALFKDKDAERVFHGHAARRLPSEIQRRARMRLQRVVTAVALADLRLPPSHRLERLRGNRHGQYSIRINDQWRVCFRWTNQGATDIEITDYH